MSIKDFAIKLVSFDFSYDSEDTKELRFNISSEIKTLLSDNDFTEYEEKQSKICIKKGKLPFAYFYDKSEFLAEIKANDIEKPILIDNYTDNQGKLFFENDITCLNNNEINDDYIIWNAKAYFKVCELFNNLSTSEKYGFEIVDNYSNSNKLITFISFKDRTKINLDLKPVGVISVNNTINYYKKIEELQSLLETENKQFSVFLKNSIISNLLYNEVSKFELFFKKIDEIIYEAKLNYNVFLHELSLDKIKTEYKEYKQKYFSSQNDVLSKITTQIIALPLSLAATSFAIYRVQGEILPTLILMIGILGYVIYITMVSKLYINDIVALNEMSLRDYKILKNHKFFIQNGTELGHFKEIKDDLYGRLKTLNFGVHFFYFTMFISSTLIIIYGFINTNLVSVDLSLCWVVSLSILYLIILFSVYYFILKGKKLRNEQ